MAIRVGFIGTGGIATVHLKALSQIADAEITALCDLETERVAQAVSNYGGNPYTDYKIMLDSEKLDAVYVCVPPHAHVGQEEDLADRGIPFFVEKPIANSVEKARHIAEAVDRANLITSVGYHWRYMSYTRAARERLKGQTIGMALGYWMGGLPGVAWWRRLDQSGGQIVEQTTHVIDLARHLCGEIAEVYAAMGARALDGVEDCTVTDVGTVTLKFASGAVGSISNSCMLKGFGYTVGLHILTPEMVVEVDSNQLRIIQTGREEIIRGGDNAYLEEDQVFIRAVQTGDDSAIQSPYRDAVKSLAVSLAANHSAQTGLPVVLKET